MTAGQTEAANEDGVAGGGDGFVDEDEMEMMDSELVAGDEEENEAVVVQLGEEMSKLRAMERAMKKVNKVRTGRERLYQ